MSYEGEPLHGTIDIETLKHPSRKRFAVPTHILWMLDMGVDARIRWENAHASHGAPPENRRRSFFNRSTNKCECRSYNHAFIRTYSKTLEIENSYANHEKRTRTQETNFGLHRTYAERARPSRSRKHVQRTHTRTHTRNTHTHTPNTHTHTHTHTHTRASGENTTQTRTIWGIWDRMTIRRTEGLPSKLSRAVAIRPQELCSDGPCRDSMFRDGASWGVAGRSIVGWLFGVNDAKIAAVPCDALRPGLGHGLFPCEALRPGIMGLKPGDVARTSPREGGGAVGDRESELGHGLFPCEALRTTGILGLKPGDVARTSRREGDRALGDLAVKDRESELEHGLFPCEALRSGTMGLKPGDVARTSRREGGRALGDLAVGDRESELGHGLFRSAGPVFGALPLSIARRLRMCSDAGQMQTFRGDWSAVLNDTVADVLLRESVASSWRRSSRID